MGFKSFRFLPYDSSSSPLYAITPAFLLEHLQDTNGYVLAVCAVLLTILVVQFRAFARPPPVPLKKLPKRPILSVLFQPEDVSSQKVQIELPTTNVVDDATTSSSPARWKRRITKSLREASVRSLTQMLLPKTDPPPPDRSGRSTHSVPSKRKPDSGQVAVETVDDDDDFENDVGNDYDFVVDYDDRNFDIPASHDNATTASKETSTRAGASDAKSSPFSHTMDLPDSFAPLLSSSHMEILTNQLTADLVHAFKAEASVRMRPGRHELPLNKDSSRPQLILEVLNGCKLSAVAMIGSDGFDTEQDLDVTQPTAKRSLPMVKNAGLVLDPPLPLQNVAPTLIHFPSLFEDNLVRTKLRRITIVRYVMDWIVSFSSFLEKCLWILESQCQVHLGKIHLVPIYKGNHASSTNTTKEASDDVFTQATPDWRLSISFSGHVLLFGWIPIPFISVTLPTFVIPQPHAFLSKLLTKQPLASARVKSENINEQRIALALIRTAESWTTAVKVVATPPTLGMEITLPGGLSIAVEFGLGRDPQGKRHFDVHLDGVHDTENLSMGSPYASALRSSGVPVTTNQNQRTDNAIYSTDNSLSSWTTNLGSAAKQTGLRSVLSTPNTSPVAVKLFDANDLVPWSLTLSAKGTINHDKMSIHILNLAANHDSYENGKSAKSHFSARGSLALWLPQGTDAVSSQGTPTKRRLQSLSKSRRNELSDRPLWESDELPSVASLLLFSEDSSSFLQEQRMLRYDYTFDVLDLTRIDAVTMSVGAFHPMLNGGTMIVSIFETIYAFGSVAARENALFNPSELKRKRDILRHLPASDFTFGVHNVFIPADSKSYSDDGQTLFVPSIRGGRLKVRLIGGIDGHDDVSIGSNLSPVTPVDFVHQGIKLIADFEVPSLVLRTEGRVKEFPELEIFEGSKLRTTLSGIVVGSVRAHLRPQVLTAPLMTSGPNIFNPLEAYEIDFSESSVSLKMKEYKATLGHRRIIFPTESTLIVKVIESVVDMGFEGKTECELAWDFQGLSPILQVTSPGTSPADAVPENKEHVSLLIAPLRQGRLSLKVSPVGGITITKAATSREDKEGLYDWKFFNALISPNNESPGRIIDVLHDKRTMEKVLQISKLINTDLHKILRYALKQIWRAKEIFSSEGVSDPKHAIPLYKMSRLLCLFITGDAHKVAEIVPIVRRVVDGEGLDIVKIKDLFRENLEHYDDWVPEIDRLIRWVAVALGPMPASQPYEEENVVPLAKLPHYANRFRNIPSASQLYEAVLNKPGLPLDPFFSNLVSRVAPYLSFRQIHFFLEARASSDWQPNDLRRIRYVYTIKRKVLDIAESYGGLSFLPQSFLVSVFLGEATRKRLRASAKFIKRNQASMLPGASIRKRRSSDVSRNRTRRSLVPEAFHKELHAGIEVDELTKYYGDVTSTESIVPHDDVYVSKQPENIIIELERKAIDESKMYKLGDSLLGPSDVAVLLQAGLTSVMKSSTVVQLNQRMLLDLICSQPRSFAVAVLSEIGSPSGQGSPRGLTSALMALLELDQTAFKPHHQIDIHKLLESWLPGLKIPRREDYMAGGRWARQSYYEALYSVATSILEDAETYAALKSHLQRVRRHNEFDPIPRPRIDQKLGHQIKAGDDRFDSSGSMSRLVNAVQNAKRLIEEADEMGRQAVALLLDDEKSAKESEIYSTTMRLYNEAFAACGKVRSLDKHAFHAGWFRDFYKRNYDALMIKSMYDNVIGDIDRVRYWLQALHKGARESQQQAMVATENAKLSETVAPDQHTNGANGLPESSIPLDVNDDLFLHPENSREQVLIDAIIDATIYDESDRELLKKDALVRMLIPNPPGRYDFNIVTAMGVITEGEKGLELAKSFKRLYDERGVKVIRADTGTARSWEFNAVKIEEAIEAAVKLGSPYGTLGYSQGCANALMAESMLLSGSPTQQETITGPNSGLVCRQLLCSAANGSFHGPAMEKKTQRLIVMCEEFFKYQQGYFSRALATMVLETLNDILDSAAFHKIVGGVQSFLPDGCRTFWREAQHLSYVPTCTLRGILEEHTTPESLEMLSHLLTKQSGSALHDSQVHVFDAVGYPVYHRNRNAKILKSCAVGEGSVQRTHHWSPLSDEVAFVQTTKDVKKAAFDCAKDRHVFPWVDVNVRFGFIKYKSAAEHKLRMEAHPSKLLELEAATKERQLAVKS